MIRCATSGSPSFLTSGITATLTGASAGVDPSIMGIGPVYATRQEFPLTHEGNTLVPGVTDDEEGLRRTADFIRSLKTVQRVEVLPYHTLGLFKWQKLGIPYPLPDAVPPTAEQVKRAEELLEVSRYPG